MKIKMRKWKSNLDEMQEQELMKLEHRTLWLGYWLLLAVILVQLIFTGSIEATLGEFIVLLIMCLYLSIDCLRLGIWDRRLKANWKTNLIASLITGSIVGLVGLARSLLAYGYTNFVATVFTLLLPFVFTAILTYGVMSLSTAIYHKRKKKLEEE